MPLPGGRFLFSQRSLEQTLLPEAVERGMAFVPGAPFFAENADASCFRMSFATSDLEKIEEGVRRMGQAL